VGAEARLRLVRPTRRYGTDDEPTEWERERLQQFADQVDSEAHWQRLLKTATTDAHRAELERIIGPLLRFRQSRCTSPGCESGLPAIYQPVLVLRKRPEDDPMWAPIELRLCEVCKAQMSARDLLVDDIWTQIIKQCVANGDPVPVRLLSQLTFDRVM
jgi:hypothetical protein